MRSRTTAVRSRAKGSQPSLASEHRAIILLNSIQTVFNNIDVHDDSLQIKAHLLRMWAPRGVTQYKLRGSKARLICRPHKGVNGMILDIFGGICFD